MWKIKLTYFKTNGKFYTEGSYVTSLEQMFMVRDEINKMKQADKLPGVVGHDFIIHVNADLHPNGYPMLILI